MNNNISKSPIELEDSKNGSDETFLIEIRTIKQTIRYEKKFRCSSIRTTSNPLHSTMHANKHTVKRWLNKTSILTFNPFKITFKLCLNYKLHDKMTNFRYTMSSSVHHFCIFIQCFCILPECETCSLTLHTHSIYAINIYWEMQTINK